ncbi:MAG: PmoA family protein [Vicinamibacteraceae bacterium]
MTVINRPWRQCVLALVCVFCAAVPTAAQVEITSGPAEVRVEIDDEPFTTFYVGGKDLNRPYLYPLRSASGKVVTRSYPAGQLPGESTDHPHHAGLFYGHGDVNGYNYWAIQNVPTPPSRGSAQRGRIVLKEPASVKSGKESGSVDVVLSWLKPDGKPLLTERRTMTFHSNPELRIVDFHFDFEALERAVFRDTKEGTFAMRMASALEEERAKKGGADAAGMGKLQNAQGGEGEENVWGKRSEWVDYAGRLDGEPVGVVIMDHPSNPRHPTYWHSRAYGLHSVNPFGVSDFLSDESKDGSLTVEAGEHVGFRYRLIVHPGLSRERIAELYREYADTGAQTTAEKE